MHLSEPQRPSWPVTALAFALLAAVCLTLTLTPLRASHDEFWHLKTGRYIAEHGLPENDVFSYTAESIPWHNHEWLGQLLFWRIFESGELNGVGGFRAVIFFKAAIITLTFLGLGAFMALRTGAPALSALAAALGCALARRTFFPRPPFLTYGLMALLLAILVCWRDRRFSTAWLLLLAPLFALWANLHGGFMAGLVVFGAFWLEAAADFALAWWRLEDFRPSRSRFVVMSLALAASVAGTLANPYGYQLYLLPGRVMQDAVLVERIFEMQPADWNFVWILDACLLVMLFATVRPRTKQGIFITALAGVALLGLWRFPVMFMGEGRVFWGLASREILGLAILLVAAARSNVSVGLAQTLLLLFFAHQALQHQRHLSLLGVVLTPVMAQSLADWIRGTLGGWDWLVHCADPELRSPEAVEGLRARRLRLVQNGMLPAIGAIAAFYLFWPGEAYYMVFPRAADPSVSRADVARAPSWLTRNRALLSGQWMEPRAYPVKAVDFLIERNLPGRIFNGGNYAGYLIWRLSPEKYKVFTDNRYDIYGGQFVRQEWAVLEAFEGEASRGLPSWRDILKQWDIRTLFIPTDQAIQRKLTAEGREGNSPWVEVWNDGEFAIWTQKPG